MHKKLVGIYEELYAQMGHSVEEEVRIIIDQAIEELGLSGRVRSDTKMFLLLNFHHLIAVPFRRAEPKLDVGAMVAEDVRVLLKAARGIAEDRAHDLINGRDVVEATVMTWRIIKSHVDPIPEA